jgi:hypothetical protein
MQSYSEQGEISKANTFQLRGRVSNSDGNMALCLIDEIHNLTAVFQIQIMNDSDEVKESLLHVGIRENEPGRSNEIRLDLMIFVFLFSLWIHFDFARSNTGIL